MTFEEKEISDGEPSDDVVVIKIEISISAKCELKIEY